MKICAISGTAKTGKNEFADLAVEFFESIGLKSKQFALADQLKTDLDQFIYNYLGIDIFSPSPKDKELIRPIMVGYGKAQRTRSEGTYWTGCLDDKLNIHDDLDVAIISDIRFAFYPGDENAWVKSKGGKIIHLTRILEDGRLLGPANEEEATHDPLIKAAADYRLTWNTTSHQERRDFVWNFLKDHPDLWKSS